MLLHDKHFECQTLLIKFINLMSDHESAFLRELVRNMMMLSCSYMDKYSSLLHSVGFLWHEVTGEHYTVIVKHYIRFPVFSSLSRGPAHLRAHDWTWLVIL